MSVYRSTVSIVQNDYGYDLEGIILDSDDVPVNLAGFTLKLIISEEGASLPKLEVFATPKIPYADGEWFYTVKDGDFDIAETEYLVEIEMQRADPEARITARGGIIYVTKEAPETS